MKQNYRIRRVIAVLLLLLTVGGVSLGSLIKEEFEKNITLDESTKTTIVRPTPETEQKDSSDSVVLFEGTALALLETLPVKGRAPKTGYSRSQFSNGWARLGECDIRNIILRRDLESIVLLEDGCKVRSGTLNDPYTGKDIVFTRGKLTSADVQIDHVVALSNAWQTGAQQLSVTRRHAFSNDPLNLLAVDGESNQQKSDGDAATWLPSNKTFRCQYVARQIAVKKQYDLWVVPPEKKAMQRVLEKCPNQGLPTY